MLENRKTKHKIGDIVFTSGNFWNFFGIPMKVIHIEKNIVTATPLTPIPYYENFDGSHLDFFTPSEILELRPEFKEKYPDIFDKNNIQTKDDITCCQKYNSKFCPDCGKLITK